VAAARPDVAERLAEVRGQRRPRPLDDDGPQPGNNRSRLNVTLR
jgi:hypothetical protein